MKLFEYGLLTISIPLILLSQTSAEVEKTVNDLEEAEAEEILNESLDQDDLNEGGIIRQNYTIKEDRNSLNHTAMCLLLARRLPKFDIANCVRTLAERLPKNIPVLKGAISANTYQTARVVLLVYMLPILATVGLIGNTATVILLLSQHLRGASSGYVAGLVIAHSLQLLTSLLIWSGIALARSDLQRGKQLSAQLFPYNNLYLTVVCTRLVAVLSVVVSVERLLILLKPTRAKRMALQRFYIPIIIACTLYTALFFVPNLFRYKPVERYNNFTGTTAYTLQVTSHYLNHPQFFENHQLAAEIIFVYLLWIAAFILVLVIVYGLKKAVRRREKALSGPVRVMSISPAQQQTTHVLLIVLAVHLICTAPAAIASLANRVNSDYGMYKKEHFLYMLMTQVNIVLAAFQGCINFPLLLVLSRNFRRAIRNMCGCCCDEYDPRRVRTMSQAHFLPTSPGAEGVNFGFSLEQINGRRNSNTPSLIRQDSRQSEYTTYKPNRERAFSSPAYNRTNSFKAQAKRRRSLTYTEIAEEDRGL